MNKKKYLSREYRNVDMRLGEIKMSAKKIMIHVVDQHPGKFYDGMELVLVTVEILQNIGISKLDLV